MKPSESAALHDREAEAAALGAALADLSAAHEVCSLPPDDFYLPQHRELLVAIKAVLSRGHQPDAVTVTNELRSTNSLRKAGGAVGVSYLIDALPDVANTSAYLELIRSHALRRRLAAIGTRLVSGDAPAAELLDRTSAELLEASGSFLQSTSQPIGVVADEVASDALAISQGARPRATIQTGLAELDERLFIRPGQLIVLAGATSTGKSSLALQIALSVAEAHGPVSFLSLEMTRAELAQRALAARSRIPASSIAAGILTREEQRRLPGAVDAIRNLPLVIDDSGGLTSEELRARARKTQITGGLAMVVVDYLQLLTPSVKGRSRAEEVGALSRSVKLMAKSLNVPVLALSQLSRLHVNENRRPELRDLRESGAIENDSDSVIALYRPNPAEDLAEVLVRKQRQGGLGTVLLKFRAPTMSFESGIGT